MDNKPSDQELYNLFSENVARQCPTLNCLLQEPMEDVINEIRQRIANVIQYSKDKEVDIGSIVGSLVKQKKKMKLTDFTYARYEKLMLEQGIAPIPKEDFIPNEKYLLEQGITPIPKEDIAFRNLLKKRYSPNIGYKYYMCIEEKGISIGSKIVFPLDKNTVYEVVKITAYGYLIIRPIDGGKNKTIGPLICIPVHDS